MIENSVIKKVGTLPGKTVAIFAAVHGNEKVGVFALEQLDKELHVKAGTVYLVYANPPAIEVNKRFVTKNLNRLFSRHHTGDTYEDTRSKELMDLLDSCDAVLDLHSYNSETGEQFAFGEFNAYAILKLMDFPRIVSRVDIDPSMYSSTVMGYVNKNGGIGICLECGTSNKGKEFTPLAVKSSYQFLQYFGIIDHVVEYNNVHQEFIKNEKMYYKKNENFKFIKDFKDFEPLPAGKTFAYDGDEVLVADNNSCIIFPRPDVPIGGEVCLIGSLIPNPLK